MGGRWFTCLGTQESSVQPGVPPTLPFCKGLPRSQSTSPGRHSGWCPSQKPLSLLMVNGGNTCDKMQPQCPQATLRWASSGAGG